MINNNNTADNAKIEVRYESGESRYGTEAVDYMLCVIEDEDGDEIELYAEVPAVEDDETASFEELKAAVLEQAEENGISADRLSF